MHFYISKIGINSIKQINANNAEEANKLNRKLDPRTEPNPTPILHVCKKLPMSNKQPLLVEFLKTNPFFLST
jgi:hypothetical protein